MSYEGMLKSVENKNLRKFCDCRTNAVRILYLCRRIKIMEYGNFCI